MNGGKEGFALYRAGNMTPAYNACKTQKELSGYKVGLLNEDREQEGFRTPFYRQERQ